MGTSAVQPVPVQQVMPPSGPLDPIRPSSRIESLVDTFNGAPIPRVRVSFKDSKGSVWESAYHQVDMQGDLVILVYDLAFEFGAKVNPPVNIDHPELPYQMTIVPAKKDGMPQPIPPAVWVNWFGISHVFTYNEKQWCFQLFQKTDPPAPNEDHPDQD